MTRRQESVGNAYGVLKPKQVRQSLKAKGYGLNNDEKGKAAVKHNLMKLLQKLAKNTYMDSSRTNNEPEILILKSPKLDPGGDR